MRAAPWQHGGGLRGAGLPHPPGPCQRSLPSCCRPRLPPLTTWPAALQDERFRVPTKDFDRQFAQLYFFRLQQTRPHVVAAAKQRWPRTPGAWWRWAASGTRPTGGSVCTDTSVVLVGPAKQQQCSSRLPPQHADRSAVPALQ